MKTFTQIIFLSFFCNILSAKTLYPGMVKLVIGTHKLAKHSDSSFTFLGLTGTTAKDISNYKSDTVSFKFFKNKKESVPLRQISFYFDWSQIPRIERIVEKDYRLWLEPMSFNDDTASGYFDIFMVCKSKSGDWLEVIINEKTKETLWIKNTKFVQFLSWNDLHKNEKFACVKKKSKLYSKPDSTSVVINSIDSDYFEILEVKGNWMNLRTGYGDCCPNESNKMSEGWINFKSKNELFIDLHIQ